MKKLIFRSGVPLLLLMLMSTGPAHSDDSDSDSDSDGQRRGAVLTGSWFLTTAAGLTDFNTFGRDGTMTAVASVIFGGLPVVPGANRSGDHGIWRHLHGRLFEAARYRFEFDLSTGDVTGIIRIRLVFSLDPGFDSAAGEFFITRWICPTATMCPDPNVAAPDVPEFTTPGFTFTMTRMKLP